MTATAHHEGLSRDSPLALLVVEDSMSDSDLVLALIEEELPHARVHVASHLQDALLTLGLERFDAVLADLSLPDADGLAVVRAVRAAHPRTALLVLTGRADGQLALWALAEGAQDYLVKGQHDGPRLATAVLHALQRQRTEQAAHRYSQLARGLLDALEAPTCAVGAGGVVLAVNEAWRSFAVDNDGDVDRLGEGCNYLDVCDGVAAGTAGSMGAAEVAAGLRGVLAGRLQRFAYEYPCHSPVKQQWFSVRITPADMDGTSGAVVSHVDVTAMHQAQRALTHQALHDALTGLPNRVLLADRLAQALADGTRRRSRVGVGFLDVDDFKRVNDSLGHGAGDALLVQLAGRLTKELRAGDTLCRYSGDEFAVVWRDLDAEDDLAALGQRLIATLDEPFVLGDASVRVSASVGIAPGGPGDDVEDLLLAAAAAKVEAKRRGGDRVQTFSDDLRRGAGAMLATEMSLRDALARSELVLHYQPVMDLQTGRPVGVEALARWQHPTRGLLPPSEFIAVAEARGLAVPLGRWALEQACRDAVAFDGPALGLHVAVNLSARQLTTPDLLAHVDAALAATGLPADRLVLEVTESALMTDEESATQTLTALSARGVGISLDDFGTGYSSLLYLRRFPITAVKLDRTFVAGMVDSADDEAICASVVSLAHAVGATSVAEGVETAEQYATLRGLGCRQAQGFLWSPAVPVEQLADVLRACEAVPVPSGRRSTRAAVTPLAPDVALRIATLHRSGASLHTIAAALDRASAPHPERLRWTAGAVARYCVAASPVRVHS
ncbi:MAG TPA: GGDEF domain-containing response regulator [Mycobacteriales bacterium]|jgi:diguanylate cyclase (GGDEF)-like protein|nr:GGDEF domain-containing response regulator [Mycobacteriales bacterium]